MKPTTCFGVTSECSSWLRTILALAMVGSTTDTVRAFEMPLSYEVHPLYVTAGPPENHIVLPGGPLGGVGQLIINHPQATFGCSGSLLPSGIHVLTAAHCVTDDAGNLSASSGTAMFEGDSGSEVRGISRFTKFPAWDGDILRGNDLAILTLDSPLGTDVARYDIYRNTNELNQASTKAGYGRSGQGNTGDTLAFGTKRSGLNLYDDTADQMLLALGRLPNLDFVPGSVLQYDFDNGLAANDAFGFFFSNPELGFGGDEALSAPGDSGSPTLIDGQIAGVTSYGLRLEFNDGSSSDIDLDLNNTFGEFGGDTRVSLYADWIDSVVVPLPGSAILLFSSLSTLALCFRHQDARHASPMA